MQRYRVYHTRKQRRDFVNPNSKVVWYDLHEDWELIESSLAKQYGMRIRHEREMSFQEFCTLVSGLMYDTPLGQIIAIRSESDPKVIKGFTAEQRRIRLEWLQKVAKSKIPSADKEMQEVQRMLKNMFYKPK